MTREHPIYKLRNKNSNDLVVFSTSFSRDTIPDFKI
uniref:Translation initiation factor 1 n=1 Tax=Viola philippica TaxID=316493 RepID=A0A7H0R1D5_9ROSI|nr:translation initiation factor 1 [Viola philippica]QNQ65234.1 translation initiation factor 1 [Viola philippica]